VLSEKRERERKGEKESESETERKSSCVNSTATRGDAELGMNAPSISGADVRLCVAWNARVRSHVCRRIDREEKKRDQTEN
jgi:hypothetical protein